MSTNYSNYFSEQSLWEKIKKFSKSAGVKVVYAVLLLYYVMTDQQVSLKTKAIIIGALGYFIFPFDAIPDLSPIIGFSDDFGVLMYALTQVSKNITPEVKSRAKTKLFDWFGTVDVQQLKELEDQIL